MAALRLFGQFLLFAALAAFSADGIKALATPGHGWFAFTSVSKALAYLGINPASLGFAQDGIIAWAWSAIVEPFMTVPLAIALTAFGALSYMAGYRRRPISEYDAA
jgi:hypothetical protein